MMRVYFDESGTLTTYLPEKSGNRRFFSIGMVATEYNSELANVVTSVVNNMGETCEELKFINRTDTMSRRFSNRLATLVEKEKAHLFGLTVDTQGMPRKEYLEADFERKMYQRFFTSLCTFIDGLEYEGPLQFHLDRCWPSRKRDLFDREMAKRIGDYFNDGYTPDFAHVDSRREKNIQCADMIAGYVRNERENSTAERYYQKNLETFVETVDLDPRWKNFRK